jgi:hypothetical protein
MNEETKEYRRGVIKKLEPAYYGCEEVMKLQSVERSRAYDTIRKVRQKLAKEEGVDLSLIPQGKVPKRYFRKVCMIDD